MNNELLKVESLQKYFKTTYGLLHAVDNVSFSIGKGRTLGIVGESGCGKSTMGRVVLGLLGATGGRILFEGRDITAAGRRERHELRKDMQIIFQDPYSSLNPRLCVSDIIAEPLKIYHRFTSKQDRDRRVEELMDTVGLARRFATSYPHELDGGRRQRIGVARALALDPKFIVCDEPVSALDVSIQAQIINLLMDLQDMRGLTYIFITHDLSVVKHISDDILVMYMGVMVEKCPTEEIFAHPMHPYTKGLLSAIPIPTVGAKRERQLMSGEVSSPIDPEPGCRFAKRCPHATDICSKRDPELREVCPGHYVACHHVAQLNAT